MDLTEIEAAAAADPAEFASWRTLAELEWDDEHFCESPSCTAMRGCVGNSGHHDVPMDPLEEQIERAGWADWDDAMALSADLLRVAEKEGRR